jgi:hypothetical protein
VLNKVLSKWVLGLMESNRSTVCHSLQAHLSTAQGCTQLRWLWVRLQSIKGNGTWGHKYSNRVLDGSMGGCLSKRSPGFRSLSLSRSLRQRRSVFAACVSRPNIQQVYIFGCRTFKASQKQRQQGAQTRSSRSTSSNFWPTR